MERDSIMKEKPKYPIKTIINCSNILDYFIKKKKPVTLTEFSEKLNLYPSSVHRILDTLNYLNYVDKLPDSESYQLGLKALELGMAKLSQIDIIKEASPFLKELSRKINENVYLGVLFENLVFYQAKVEAFRSIKLETHLGTRGHFNCTALGKVLVAFLPKSEREKIYQNMGFHKSTKNSITSKKQFEKEISKVKSEGFAIDNEENEKNIQCIAAPIRDYSGDVIAAISISGPLYRFNLKEEKAVRAVREEIIQYAQKISKCLGYNI